MERLLTVFWDQFVAALQGLQEPPTERVLSIKAGEEFLERIMSQDLPAEYLLNLPDETLSAAWEIATHGNDNSEPLVNMAQMRIDETVWAETLHECLRLPATCDPSIAEAFI